MYLAPLGLVFGLLSAVFLRRYLVTRAKSELFVALAVIVVTIYVLLVRFAERGEFRSELDSVAVLLFIIFGSLGMAWCFTVDSGVIREAWKNASVLSWLLGRPQPIANSVPPRISRRAGILAGVFLIVFAAVDYLLFPSDPIGLPLFLCTGAAMVVLSVLKLK